MTPSEVMLSFAKQARRRPRRLPTGVALALRFVGSNPQRRAAGLRPAPPA